MQLKVHLLTLTHLRHLDAALLGDGVDSCFDKEELVISEGGAAGCTVTFFNHVLVQIKFD